MKKFYAMALMATASLYVCGQQLYFEDFENGMPSNYILHNLDGLEPDDPGLINMKDSAWTVQQITSQGWTHNKSAFSVSWYVNDAGPSDDWMILPAITIGNEATLKWDAMAITSSGIYRDRYQIFISEDTSLASFALNPPVFDTSDSGEVADPVSRSLDLIAAGFANKTIHIAFRNWTKPYNPPISVGGNELAIDNIEVVAGAVGLSEFANVSGFKAYPNPVIQDKVWIEFEAAHQDQVHAYIMNAGGKVVAVHDLGNLTTGNQRFELNMEHLASGVYFISLEGKATKASLRLVK